jgi:type IV pilus assembly protein PilQ
MRLKQPIALSGLLLMGLATAAAQTASLKGNVLPASTAVTKSEAAATVPHVANVQHVSVSRGKDSLDVEIVGDAQLNHKEMLLENPARLVIDFANAEPSTSLVRIPVHAAEAKSIRIGRFQDAPPVTRVVVDLGTNVDYSLSADGAKVVVHLHSQAPEPIPHPDVKIAVASNVVPKPASTPVLPPDVKPPVVKTQASTNSTALMNIAAHPTVVMPNQPQPKGDAETSSARSPQPSPQPTPQSGPARSQNMQTAATGAANTAASSANGENPPSPASSPASQQPTQQTSTSSFNPNAAVNLAREQQQIMQAPTAAPQKTHYSGEPIWVNLKDADLKDFFRLIHEISGLNVVLDPNVKGSLTLVLDAVPWDQALDIVLLNNGLDKEIDGNVLRIATVETLKKEAEAQKAREEAQAAAVGIITYTHYLSYAHSKDVIPTIKKFLSSRGDVISDDRTNAVIVRDIPGAVPEIQKLLVQLDRKTQQVEIEARVVAATRNFVRDIGTQLGFGFGSNAVHLGGAPNTGPSPIGVPNCQGSSCSSSFNAPGSTTNSTGPGVPPYILSSQTTSIPLFSNLGVQAPTSGFSLSALGSNYRLDSILTLAESRGLLKILSRPRVVTQNNIQALVRQGVKVPVVTASQLGGPPTVTYVDAFLRLTVTPQITAEGTVFLNVEVENTTPDFSRTVQGNPTLVTQQAQTNVLVTNGGTVVIGGVIQTTNSVNVSQVPLLGDIPILGNAFKHRTVSTSTQELIFFITPKIIET